VRCVKNPIDLAIYVDLLWQEEPRTVIEIGAAEGGSALWFADMMRVLGLEPRVVSIDIRPPAGIHDPAVNVLRGDTHDLAATFDANDLHALPRPWFVVEDSAHTFEACLAALEYLSTVMAPGEMLAMEDGILTALGLERQHNGGPNRAIATFFERWPGRFAVEARYCDMFGENLTYNPNGYLRRIQ
jgi:cephalosporin hydroxylase